MSTPQYCPTPRELDDLELLLSGAAAPLTAFNEPGSPLTLALPGHLASSMELELVDPEGLPLARAWRRDDLWQLERINRPEFGPFRRLFLNPGTVRERYAGRTFVPVAGPLSQEQVERIDAAGPVVLLALAGTGRSELTRVGLVRATLVAANDLDAVVVAVPLAAHGDPEQDHTLGLRVVATYAAGDDVLGLPAPGDRATYDPEVLQVIAGDHPPPGTQGLVVMFTGLSGSGKSTLARALMDRIAEQGLRTVTSLDGDVVRRHLSAGLGFSRADRETNILRIGWVAAEISRHGGIAVCSPIAPFDATRQQVKHMIEQAGGAFVLVHVATPLEECERRDRKGLYAKARRGEIPDFTGISSPYEEPDDATLTVDTTGRGIEEVLSTIWRTLESAGHLERA